MTNGELGFQYFSEIIAVITSLDRLLRHGGVFKASLAVERVGGIGEIKFPDESWLEIYNPGTGWLYSSSQQVKRFGKTQPIEIESREHVRELVEADLGVVSCPK